MTKFSTAPGSVNVCQEEWALHPEWFEWKLRRTYLGDFRGIPIYKVDALTNPPLIPVRNPVPFILPIRGCGGPW